jgi:integrative and conjugative element protein (TIGR02256 family)
VTLWATPNDEYGLQVSTTAWEQIECECAQIESFETGGILLGSYTPDRSTAIITEASAPPQDSRRGSNWFHRGVSGLRELLNLRWNQAWHTYYVGEWHFHPSAHVAPSADDLSQMQAISIDTKYHCREPILLIIGRSTVHQGRPVRAFVFPRGHRFYEFFQAEPSKD